MSALKALLFDVDGTLVDTEELHRQAFNQAFLEFGLGWNWNNDLYGELLAVSGGVERIAHYIDWLKVPAAEKTRLRRIIPSIHREKTRIHGELVASNTSLLRPGVARLFDEARGAGLRIGLAATSALDNVHTLIDAALTPAQRESVGAIVCVAQVGRKKPAPDIYESLLTQLRVPSEASVAFEDSTNGVMAAKAARLFTVATPSRWTRDRGFTDADLVLESLGDPGRPLSGRDSARLGGAPYVGLAQIEAARAASGFRRPASAQA